jgi:hypothetical protein
MLHLPLGYTITGLTRARVKIKKDVLMLSRLILNVKTGVEFSIMSFLFSFFRKKILF